MKYTFSKARSFASAAIMVASLLFMATAFLGCEDEQKKAPVVKVKRTYKGDVEVLNSCGMQGAAAKMRSYLREKVLETIDYRTTTKRCWCLETPNGKEPRHSPKLLRPTMCWWSIAAVPS